MIRKWSRKRKSALSQRKMLWIGLFRVVVSNVNDLLTWGTLCEKVNKKNTAVFFFTEASLGFHIVHNLLFCLMVPKS